jgi:hypothetical protein
LGVSNTNNILIIIRGYCILFKDHVRVALTSECGGKVRLGHM